MKWHIETYARLRPPRQEHESVNFDLEDGRTIIAFSPPDDDNYRLQCKPRGSLNFNFNEIFDSSISQEQVFNKVCLDIVHSALDGYNGTILAYGQTGSGKTYTITGGKQYVDRGIIPRVLSTIFEEFEKQVNKRYLCYISYLEIYNENVYDLLDRSHTNRPIEEWPKVCLQDDDEGEMHFRNLSVFETVSEEEALNLLFLGNMNRITSDTPMNQASSRSHAIFTIMIESRSIDSDMIVTSKLHLVDLAGSERVYKHNGTERMRTEGKHINLSLHHLEQVILSLRKKRTAVSRPFHIPYRNSMLTSVLKDSLGGNCKSVFIATLNPEQDYLDESISTCRFMQRCSEVTVDVAISSQVDAVKRLETVEKRNAELETTNLKLQQRVLQLENDIQANAFEFSKQEEQWGQRLALSQEEARNTLIAAKKACDQSDQVGKKVDWAECEEIVERLLCTGNLPREELDKVPSGGEFLEANHLYEAVVKDIRELGMTSALGCLVVLKEKTLLASKNATDLEDFMTKQSQTVEVLEQRLQEQKDEAEVLKEQLQSIMKVNKRHPAPLNSIERGKSNNKGDHEAVGSVHDNENDIEAYESAAGHSSSLKKVKSMITDRRDVKQFERSNSTGSGDKQFAIREAKMTRNEIASLAPAPAKNRESSPNDLTQERMKLLRNGSVFLKYGRFGQPHLRFVWCSADLTYLHYRLVNRIVAKATFPISSITRICAGQETRVFDRANVSNRAPHCFSVEYEGNRTLDLEICDGESLETKIDKRNSWVEALQLLVKLKTSLHQSLSTQIESRE